MSRSREELGRALRALIETLGTTSAPDSEFDALSATIDAAAQRFAAQRRERSTSGMLPGMGDFALRGPIGGRGNPVAPPAVLEPNRGTLSATGRVTFGHRFEGAPGLVHGGFVAAVLDEILGMVSAMPGTPAMTGELKVRFKRPTPIDTELELRARVDESRGRRILVSGEVLAHGLVTAAATGLFVGVGNARFEELERERQERSASD
jgi:acyl-coenzyme A thioesterase PaaI-like protein